MMEWFLWGSFKQILSCDLVDWNVFGTIYESKFFLKQRMNMDFFKRLYTCLFKDNNAV